jgi:HlyD family secretion protein
MNLNFLKSWKLAVLLLVLLAIGLGAWLLLKPKQSSKAVAAENFVTQKVSVGDVRRMVSASGTLKPVSQIDVGTQVSGTIRSLHVDFNDVVKEGQLLAELFQFALEIAII